MAASLKERDLNECPVCMEVYEKPQILLCSHSLCERCLDRITFNETVRCPLCNAVCSRKTVKPDFRLAQFLDILSEQKSLANVQLGDKKPQYQCQMCERNVFAFWCNNCALWVCETCRKSHFKSKPLKDHEMISLEEKILTRKRDFKTSFMEGQRILKEASAKCANAGKHATRVVNTKSAAIKNSKRCKSQVLTQINKIFKSFRDEISKIPTGVSRTDTEFAMRHIRSRLRLL